MLGQALNYSVQNYVILCSVVSSSCFLSRWREIVSPNCGLQYGEPLWNDTGGKTEDLEKNLSQCHFFQHKTHLGLPGREPGPSR